jgi:hypothetical protein
MKTIAVVCAPPPHLNAGMHSVDLAFQALAARHSLPATIRYLSLHTPGELSPTFAEGSGPLASYGLPLAYERLRGNDGALLDADVIVYWGDFHHARGYRAGLAKRLARIGLAPSESHALDEIDRHLFLRDAPDDALEKVVIFGECLLDERGPESPHRHLFARLVRGARLCRMRDVHSALRVAELRGDLGRSSLGVDCALLLQPGDTDTLPRSSWSREAPSRATAGLFFGRTTFPRDELLRFARQLVEAMDVDAEWIPWFGKRVAPPENRGAAFPQLSSRAGPHTLGDLYTALSRCRFVITDAYHLCVNAWRQGIPAVCVGTGGSSLVRFHEKKKETFHLMYGASRFYVFTEELSADPSALAADAAAALGDADLVRSITTRIRSHARAAEDALVGELSAMLASRQI